MPPGNRLHAYQTGLFAHRFLSIQQDEPLATAVYGLIAEHSAALPGRSLVIECTVLEIRPRNP